jgi:ureidoacrylate peracid hydrolase
MSQPSRSVTMNARPAETEFDPSTTAVMVVDMQHDFASPNAMFGVNGLPLDGIASVVEPTSRVLHAARAVGIPVVYLAMQFSPDLSDVGPENSASRKRHLGWGVGQPVTGTDGAEGRILVSGMWNTQIIDELAPEPGDIVIPKHRYSGFFETNLDETLRQFGVATLIFTGCTTSVCVESTLRDAYYRDYACVLLRDCCAEIVGADESRTNHDASLTLIEGNFGWTSTSSSFISALGSRHS